jgi:hypothetical protein
VRSGDAYRFDMGAGFCPFRRDVAWAEAREAPIAPLLDALELTAGESDWGRYFRFGLFALSAPDFARIATAMNADLSVLPQRQRERATITYGEPWGRFLRSKRLAGSSAA